MCCETTRPLLRLPHLLCALGVLFSVAPTTAAQLLVVSQGDARVLEYDAADGSFVAPFVEPVTTGFAFPGGIAIRPADGQLYVASTGSGEIWIYDTSTGLVSPPPAATGLLVPGGLVFDASGSNLYFIADVPNGPDTDAALRRLSLPGGSVTTLASDAAASFTGIALEGGNLYVSDSFNSEVVRYPAAGGNGTTVASGLSSPAGILFLSSTEMLIAESGADRVVEYHESGGNWVFDREVMAASAGIDGPFGLALAPDGRLSVSGAFSNDIAAIDLGTLVVTTLVASGNGLAVPGQIAWSGNTLLVASRASNTVNYFDENGAKTGTVARGLTAPADAGMALTAGGNVLVASIGGNNVIEYDSSTGGVVRTLPNACTISLTQPFDVEVDAAGDILVTCPPIDGVRRFDEIGVSVPFVIAGSGGLGSPRGLAFGPNGNLFVASGTGEVLEYDGSTGGFVGVFVDTTGNGGGPVDPYGLAFHQGSLFVASFFPSEVKEFDAGTGAFVQTFVTSGAGGLSGPSGLAFGPDGDLYVTSYYDNAVRRYNGSNGSFVEVFVASGSGGLSGPFDIQFVPEPTATIALASGALLLWGLCALRLRASRGVSR
jgi:DNA-binding beta-propeller fold protein YncE